jgi:Tfp pilus assembly protein PilF
MKFRDLSADLVHFLIRSKIALACVLILLSLVSPTSSQGTQNTNNDEVRNLVKKGVKLARYGSLAEAEKTLRQAIELAPDRSDAKVELAYVLVKSRRLFMPIRSD